MCTLGCQSAKPKSGELWLIDSDDSSLYRVLNNGDEEYIPIHENPDISKFVCMDMIYVSSVCPSQKSYLDFLIQNVPVKNLLGN